MERREVQNIPVPHQLIMQDRNRLDITGISDVDSFDDATIIVFTSFGELTIKGKEMQVRRLDVEGGNLSLEGQIDTLSYSNAMHNSGILGKLLR